MVEEPLVVVVHLTPVEEATVKLLEDVLFAARSLVELLATVLVDKIQLFAIQSQALYHLPYPPDSLERLDPATLAKLPKLPQAAFTTDCFPGYW